MVMQWPCFHLFQVQVPIIWSLHALFVLCILYCAYINLNFCCFSLCFYASILHNKFLLLGTIWTFFIPREPAIKFTSVITDIHLIIIHRFPYITRKDLISLKFELDVCRARSCSSIVYHWTYFMFLSPLVLLNIVWRLTFSGRMRKACKCKHPLTHKWGERGKCTDYLTWGSQ